MADRTWNGIDGRLWDELDALDAVILAMIISKCPNEHGVYDLPRKALSRFVCELYSAIVDPRDCEDRLEYTLTSLTKQGIIRLYPKGSVWICSKFKRARFKHIEANQRSACLDIREHNVETLTDFMSAYCPDIKLDNVGTTDPDPDPDPEPEIKPKSSSAHTKRVRPDRPSLSELESALAPECMPAWCQWKAVLAGVNKTGSVSEQRLAICLEHILTIAEQEQLTKAALSYGLCAGAAKGFKKRYQQPENYALAAARSYEPPDNRPDAEYYAGSPEHQRLKAERLPDEIR